MTLKILPLKISLEKHLAQQKSPLQDNKTGYGYLNCQKNLGCLADQSHKGYMMH